MSSNYSVLCVRQEPSEPFQSHQEIFDSPPFENQDFSELSQRHGEIIYLAEQENVGFVHYEHWSNGSLLRRLKYNNDGSWLSADGEPEAWESPILFSPALLEKTLQNWDADGHTQLREVWSRQRIQEGDLFPILGLLDFIGDLRRFWKLP